MEERVEIYQKDLEKRHFPNWYLYDTLKEHGFPMKLKDRIYRPGLNRSTDLDFDAVELTGCFKMEDDVLNNATVYTFERVFEIDANELRNNFSSKFVSER